MSSHCCARQCPQRCSCCCSSTPHACLQICQNVWFQWAVVTPALCAVVVMVMVRCCSAVCAAVSHDPFVSESLTCVALSLNRCLAPDRGLKPAWTQAAGCIVVDDHAYNAYIRDEAFVMICASDTAASTSWSRDACAVSRPYCPKL